MKTYMKPGLLACLALLSGAFVTGLFFSGYRDIHYAPVSLAMLALGCAAAVPVCLRGAVRWPFSGFAVTLFAFWILLTLGLSWSNVPFASLVTYLVFLTLPLAFFAPLAMEEPLPFLRAAFAVLMTALALLAAGAVFQHFAVKGEFGARAYLPLGDPGNLAALLNLGLLPALAMALGAEPKSRASRGAAALALLLFAGLCATESRGGLLAFAAAAAVLLFMLRAQARRRLALLAALGAGAAAVFVLSGLPDGLRMAHKMAALAAGGDSGTGTRLAIWHSALAMMKDHIWLGTGFGTFYLYYPPYRLPADHLSTGYWAHMDSLQFGAELGFAGIAFFYAAAAAAAVRTARALRDAQQGDRVMIAGLSCGALALFLHSHTNFQFYVMPSLAVLGIWLAYLHLLTGPHSFRTVFLHGWQKPFMAGACLFIAGLIGLMAVSAASGTHHLLKARERLAQGDVAGFVDLIGRADRTGPASFIDPEVYLAGFYIGMLENPLDILPDEDRRSAFEQAAALLNAAQAMNPVWADIDFKRARLFLAAGKNIAADADGSLAILSLESAIRKNPMLFAARVKLAALYMNQGRAGRAHEIMNAGLAYPMPSGMAEKYRDMTAGLKKLDDAARAFIEKREKERAAPPAPAPAETP